MTHKVSPLRNIPLFCYEISTLAYGPSTSLTKMTRRSPSHGVCFSTLTIAFNQLLKKDS
eukprot:TRINITY_DN9581_c0_g1_i1.p1 TRINITY_DN9581_c0_g1~~TRINITY_DN9581_c0_g1_i1.p1  ORF type:complete len:59 (-),score=0.78 TRINITY_DN9581_c0_g1_i1:223-399(-)